MQDQPIDQSSSDSLADTTGRSIILIFGTLVAAVAITIACEPHPDPDQAQVCDSCASGYYNFSCELDILNQVTHQYKVVCATDYTHAEEVVCPDACANWDWNGQTCLDVVDAPDAAVCLDTDASTEGNDDGPWAPGDFVSYSGGTYWIQGGFAEMVKNDPSLVANDTAWLDWTSTYWQWKDVQSTSLAYKLGFRTNDFLKTVNGRSIGNNLQTALDALHDYHDDTSFTVTVGRGSTTVTLYYQIWYD